MKKAGAWLRQTYGALNQNENELSRIPGEKIYVIVANVE